MKNGAIVAVVVAIAGVAIGVGCAIAGKSNDSQKSKEAVDKIIKT